MTWSTVAPSPDFPLDRHNVFFSQHYESEFKDIFLHHRTPRSPTVYVCAHDRPFSTSSDGEGRLRDERFLCLINAPAAGERTPHGSWEIDACATRTFARLASSGLRMTPHPNSTIVRTPADFERMFPGTGGALYGTASHGWMASFQRPGATTRMPNLYLAGGSTHPGPGVPMAVLSGSLAARAVLADQTSTATYRRAATPGGISTPPVTTRATR